MISKIIILLILPGYALSHVLLPESTYTSNEHGVIMHPDSLVFQYESTYRLTIGVRMDVIPSMGDLISEYKGWCKLKQDNRDKVWKRFDEELGNYTEMLFNMTHENRGTLTELPSFSRERRGVAISLAIAASISAIGMNLYEWLWDDDADDAQTEKINELTDGFNRLKENHQQYKKLSHKLFMKVFHGSQDEALMARQGFCTGSTEREVHFSYLFFSLLLDQFKRDMDTAIDGKVTDFLITHDLLVKDLLSQTDFTETIYQKDQSLVYHLSSCSLFRVDRKKKIAYFTVSIPLVLNDGVSLIYRVRNFGWEFEGIRKMFDLPTRVTPSTYNNKMLVAVGDEDCKVLQSGHLCRSSAGRRTPQTECLTSLVFSEVNDSCKEVPGMYLPGCHHAEVPGGIVLISCSSVQVTMKQGSDYTLKVLKLPSSRTLFVAYDSFYKINVGGKEVRSKFSRVKSIIKEPHLNLLTAVSNPIPLPSVGTELDQLSLLLLDSIDDIDPVEIDYSRYVLVTMIFVAILTILGLLIWYKRSKQILNLPKSDPVAPMTVYFSAQSHPLEL